KGRIVSGVGVKVGAGRRVGAGVAVAGDKKSVTEQPDPATNKTTKARNKTGRRLGRMARPAVTRTARRLSSSQVSVGQGMVWFSATDKLMGVGLTCSCAQVNTKSSSLPWIVYYIW